MAKSQYGGHTGVRRSSLRSISLVFTVYSTPRFSTRTSARSRSHKSRRESMNARKRLGRNLKLVSRVRALAAIGATFTRCANSRGRRAREWHRSGCPRCRDGVWLVYTGMRSTGESGGNVVVYTGYLMLFNLD